MKSKGQPKHWFRLYDKSAFPSCVAACMVTTLEKARDEFNQQNVPAGAYNLREYDEDGFNYINHDNFSIT